MPIELTKGQVGLWIARLEPSMDRPPRNKEYHELRKAALHRELDENPSLWAVRDWGETDDTDPHEFVSLVLDLFSDPGFQSVALPVVGYLAGKLCEATLDSVLIEPFKELIKRLLGIQKKKEIESVQVQLPDGTYIDIKPGKEEPEIHLHLRVQ